MSGLSVSARDTVLTETPACSAMSRNRTAAEAKRAFGLIASVSGFAVTLHQRLDAKWRTRQDVDGQHRLQTVGEMRHRSLRQDDDIVAATELDRRLADETVMFFAVAGRKRLKGASHEMRLDRNLALQLSRMFAHQIGAWPLGARRRAENADAPTQHDRPLGHRVVDLEDGRRDDTARDVHCW